MEHAHEFKQWPTMEHKRMTLGYKSIILQNWKTSSDLTDGKHSISIPMLDYLKLWIAALISQSGRLIPMMIMFLLQRSLIIAIIKIIIKSVKECLFKTDVEKLYLHQHKNISKAKLLFDSHKITSQVSKVFFFFFLIMSLFHDTAIKKEQQKSMRMRRICISENFIPEIIILPQKQIGH